jgi:hypothetical protein
MSTGFFCPQDSLLKSMGGGGDGEDAGYVKTILKKENPLRSMYKSTVTILYSSTSNSGGGGEGTSTSGIPDDRVRYNFGIVIQSDIADEAKKKEIVDVCQARGIKERSDNV